MRIATWNVNQRRGRETAVDLCRLLDEDLRADVITLQEVGWGRDENYEHELERRGFQWSYARQRNDDRLYGSAIAVRRSVLSTSPRQRIGSLPLPELVDCVRTTNGITILSVHIPNGAGYGWKKIETWETLIPWISRVEGPLVFAGDFNAPGIETGERTYCFGYDIEWEGERTDALYKAAHEFGHARAATMQPRLFERWTFDGVTDTGERWEAAEGWIYDKSRGHGLVDAFRSVHGYGDSKDAYSHLTGRKTPVRYDHIFLRGLTASSALYRIDLLERWSDHAPLVVEAKLD